MYIVMEIQKSSEGALSTLVTTHDTKNKAENKYYTILAYAAVSTLPLHGAVMLHEDGYFIKNEVFTHVPESEPEEA